MRRPNLTIRSCVTFYVRRRRQQGADGSDQSPERDDDEIYVGDGQGDVTGDHHASGEHPVQQIDERDPPVVVGSYSGFSHGLPRSLVNEYGGHGPVISSWIPVVVSCNAATAARNSSTRCRSTR